MQQSPLQAVILAAGRGERMRALARSKPLLPILGMPALERLIRTVHQCGIDDFIVVTGHEHQTIKDWLDDFSQQLPANTHIQVAFNSDWEDHENGSSLLAAAPHIRGPFLLLMADHVYDVELIDSLCQAPLPEHGAVLATDTSVLRTDIDLDDVTRVQLDQSNIVTIDKHLNTYQGFDTGAFLCSAAVIKAMQEAFSQRHSRISDAMQRLADQGQLLAHQVDGLYWQDVDTPEALALTEQALLEQAAGKTADGPVARWLNRPLSRQLTRKLAHTGITPNQISLAAFGLSLVAALLMAIPWWPALALGGVLVQLASVVDGCDGELSRLQLNSTGYGGWLDAVLDRYADTAILAAMMWNAMQVTGSTVALWAGLLAISGSLISSYSAHKVDDSLPAGSLRIGRDSRSLVIMVGAIFNQPLITLWIIAVIMNAVVLRRLLNQRHQDWAVPSRRPAPVVRYRSNAADIDLFTIAKDIIRARVAQSPVAEDAGHAEDTLQWLLKLRPNADPALQLAALAHDIERARPERLKRQDFDDYDAFKTAHARESAAISDALLVEANIPASLRKQVYRLIERHEFGGCPDSDLLKDADSLSYFSHNMPLYFEREGWDATLNRARWGYQRLSERARQLYTQIEHDNETLNKLLHAATTG